MTETTKLNTSFPLYIIGNNIGVVAVDYEGYSCCLIYSRRQYAELYAEEAAQAGGGMYQATTIWTFDKLQFGLNALKPQGIDHVAWDATFRHSDWKIFAIDELLSMLGDQPSDEQPKTNQKCGDS